ncbi:MAG: DUF4824 family protein [Xanthomonadales bacterium]|nr:DUF4824 family protein [Xanthomonadales bacterium]
MRRLAGLALLLAVAAPAWLLAGAAWNRVGEPRASLVLDSGELAATRGHGAPGGVSLRLRWNGVAEQVLAAERLRLLGFDLSPPAHSRRVRQRRAYALFELDSARWQAQVDQAQAALVAVSGGVQPEPMAAMAGGEQAMIDPEPEAESEPEPDSDAGADALRPPTVRAARWRLQQAQQASRLFLREVAPDADSLHALCADPERCLVLPVGVRLLVQPVSLDSRSSDDRDGEPARTALRGQLTSELLPTIHVSPRWHPLLSSALSAQQAEAARRRRQHDSDAAIAGHDNDAAPATRWQVLVHQGRRLELWLAGVTVGD